MKILHIITGLAVGGAEVLLLELCGEHKRAHRQQKVIYLTPRRELLGEFEKQGIETVFVDSSKGLLSAVCKVVNQMRRWRPDIVHTHLPRADTIGRIAGLCSLRVPIFSTIHNADEWKRSKALSSRLLRQFNQFSVNGINRVQLIAVSEMVRKYCIKYEKINEKKIVTIPNFIPSNLKKRSGKISRESLGIAADSFILVNVGRLVPQKNQMAILHAAEHFKGKYPQLIFLIIGEGECRAGLEACCRERKLENVRLLGKKFKIFDYYKIGNMFLLTSSYEGMPVAVLEALSCGLPVIGPRLPALQEIIRPGENGILYDADGDQEKLFEVIEKAVTGSFDLPEMSARAYASVSGRTLDNYLERLLELYTGEELTCP